MRTTVNLDGDVAAAVEHERRARGTGLSEAINGLIRRGLTIPDARTPFVQRVEIMGLKIDVTNVAEALEQLEGPSHR